MCHRKGTDIYIESCINTWHWFKQENVKLQSQRAVDIQWCLTPGRFQDWLLRPIRCYLLYTHWACLLDKELLKTREWWGSKSINSSLHPVTRARAENMLLEAIHHLCFPDSESGFEAAKHKIAIHWEIDTNGCLHLHPALDQITS